jgi:hypothetical protein
VRGGETIVEDEFVISNLRGQVGNLQSVLSYLESREQVRDEDYSFLHAKLREVIKRLMQMERWSRRRGRQHPLHAEWLN